MPSPVKPAITLETLSVDSRLLYDALIALPVGETISYETMTACIGRDVQGVGRGALQTARRMALRENRMVFGVRRDIGLVRLSDAEIVGTGARTLRSIGRKARRGATVLSSVTDYTTLADEDKRRHNATFAILGMIEHTSREKNVLAISKQITDAPPSIAETMQRTLSAFKGEK